MLVIIRKIKMVDAFVFHAGKMNVRIFGNVNHRNGPLPPSPVHTASRDADLMGFYK